MNWKSCTIAFFLLFVTSIVFGQNDCFYRLQLFDSFGDGWAGAAVELTVGDSTALYTLDSENDNGAFRQFSIPAIDGDTLNINFSGGSFDIDVSYKLLNPEGIIVFSDELLPTQGNVFSGNASCPTCFVTNPSSVSIDDVRASTTAISWIAPDSNNIYQIEYGTSGFVLGSGTQIQTPDTELILRDLQENTSYDFYVTVLCPDGDVSTTIGPRPFTTRWAVDIALTEVVGPETKCMIDRMDSVKVTLKNFGGNPQSLIPFKFSVNGQSGGVPDFLDGYYTDVLSKDSSVTIAFETLYDFTEPGIYDISAWTEFEGDSDISNDTANLTVVNIPVIFDYPYFENFETWIGGWTITSNSENATWERGLPQGNNIRGAKSGSNAYVTNLTGEYASSERSYLLSPCYNFSELVDDPNIVFSINLNTEEFLDNAWLELSIDGGEVWEKVGTAGTGINWYNDDLRDTWTGDGGFDMGWQTAVNTLTGTAGQPDVRLRFAFEADFTNQEDGIGVDDIFIAEPTENDLAAVQTVNTSDRNCGSQIDQVVLTMVNLGTEAQSNFLVSYQINDGAISSESVGPGFVLQPGQQADYTIQLPFNSSVPGTYEIRAWTDLVNDAFLGTDTTTFTFTTLSDIPYTEDFENGNLPVEWTTDEEAIVAQEHGNTSFVLFNNMWSGDVTFTAESPRLGITQRNDSLVFDYRFVDFLGDGSVPKVLSGNDNLIVQISTDCGENYQSVFVIDQNNHEPKVGLTTVSIPLSSFVGQFIRVRFIANWGEGDYFVDIDNINIPRCTGDLGLVSTVKDATEESGDNGQISLEPTKGVAPYIYEWSTGDSTSTITNLAPRLYQVTVTDRFGCSESLDFSIIVGTEDEIEAIEAVKLYPNPTGSMTNLSITFTQPTDLNIEVLNLVGQSIQPATQLKGQTQTDLPIDLSRQPEGIYLVRVWAGQQFFVKQIVKSGF